ncbi:B2 protein [Morella rubra]|uniref:B2 protein n=1 Tax=Morella rubra TaxID=262757 RepID=A0A6A1VVZ4_9ROSI|nr:B2 protein [Morella rubra]
MEMKDIEAGRFPKYGAIFMSNRSTMEECFERKLFGLPASLTNFVRGVKVGMLLFLFEYEERKLYGVFEATSDGEKNIVACAYRSSGRQFPAQVQFNTIWHCDPLSETDFSHAIKTNYYEKHKFHFGLSKDQVQSLLLLFDSRKVGVSKSLTFADSARERLHKNSIRKREVEDLDNQEVEEGQPKTLRTENSCVSVVSTGDADSSHSYLKPLECSDKVIQEDEGSLVGSPCILCSGDLDVLVRSSSQALDLQFSSALTTSHSSAFENDYGTCAKYPSGNQPGTFQEEPEKLKISSRSSSTDLGDFIPLTSPDHAELADAEDSCLEAGDFENNQAESANFECYNDISFPKPCVPLRLILSGETFRQEKNLDHLFAATCSNGGTCWATTESASSDDSLRNFCNGHILQCTDCQEESDFDYGDKNPSTKGLYSDTVDKNTSVFSRLDVAIEDFVQEKKDDTRADTSGNEIVGELQQMLDKLRRMKQAESGEHDNEDCNEKKRIGAFYRLKRASEVVRHDNYNTRRLQWGTGERKEKIKNVKFAKLERKDYSRVEISGNKSLEILASKDTTQEKDNGSRVDKSADEIMEGLLQRENKWRGKAGKDRSLRLESEDYCAKKRTSVFLRLTRD